MSQQGIYDLMKNHPDQWFSTKDFARMMGVSQSTATVNVMRLRKSGFLQVKKEEGSKNGLLYKLV